MGKSVEEAREMVMDQLRARNKGVSVTMGEAESDKFRAAAQDAVLMAAGIPVAEPAAGAQELRGYSMIEMARESLRRESDSTVNFGDNMELARAAINSNIYIPCYHV